MKKPNFHWLLKYYQLLFNGFILAILIFVSLFLYKNFYQTITQAKKISFLQAQVVQKKINTTLFEKIITALTERKKQKPIDWAKVKNPFR